MSFFANCRMVARDANVYLKVIAPLIGIVAAVLWCISAGAAAEVETSAWFNMWAAGVTAWSVGAPSPYP
jgi:hypothetical protein